GFDRSGKPIAKAFRFDPAANRWERIGDLPAPRHHMPLAVAGDTLYAVGGLAEATFVPENTLWIYREDQNRWEPRAPLPSPRGAGTGSGPCRAGAEGSRRRCSPGRSMPSAVRLDRRCSTTARCTTPPRIAGPERHRFRPRVTGWAPRRWATGST